MRSRGGIAMGRSEWLLLLALALVWSTTFLFVKIALAGISPLSVVLGRVGFAAVALAAAMRVLRQPMPRQGKVWRAFLVMGAINNLVPFSLLAWGQTHVASGLAAILNATTPLFTILIAHVATEDEKITAAKLAGLLLGLAGVVLMIGTDLLERVGDYVAGELACLGAAFCYALAGLYGRRFRRLGLSPLATATGQVTAATLLLLPIAVLADRPWNVVPLPGPEVWAALLAAGVICTALGYVLYFHILARAGATNLMLVTLLMPAGAVLLGALVLGERLAFRHLLGLGFLIIGLIAIDGRWRSASP